jgi:hypothetical protein
MNGRFVFRVSLRFVVVLILFQFVADKFKGCGKMDHCNILSVERVQNYKLMKGYEAKMKLLADEHKNSLRNEVELYLFHGTRKQDPMVIAADDDGLTAFHVLAPVTQLRLSLSMCRYRFQAFFSWNVG